MAVAGPILRPAINVDIRPLHLLPNSSLLQGWNSSVKETCTRYNDRPPPRGRGGREGGYKQRGRVACDHSVMFHSRWQQSQQLQVEMPACCIPALISVLLLDKVVLASLGLPLIPYTSHSLVMLSQTLLCLSFAVLSVTLCKGNTSTYSYACGNEASRDLSQYL